MSQSLFELIKRDEKKMIHSLSEHERGNIYSLILNEVERVLLQVALQETNYNIVRSSRVLGISRSTLYRRMEALKIKKE